MGALSGHAARFPQAFGSPLGGTILGCGEGAAGFLKTAGLFDAFVADCPLRYVSPNAPFRAGSTTRF